jgi:hypothetical protein
VAHLNALVAHLAKIESFCGTLSSTSITLTCTPQTREPLPSKLCFFLFRSFAKLSPILTSLSAISNCLIFPPLSYPPSTPTTIPLKTLFNLQLFLHLNQLAAQSNFLPFVTESPNFSPSSEFAIASSVIKKLFSFSALQFGFGISC